MDYNLISIYVYVFVRFFPNNHTIHPPNIDTDIFFFYLIRNNGLIPCPAPIAIAFSLLRLND